MRKYTFFIRERDQQAGLTKYHKIHMPGKDIQHAHSNALKYIRDKFSGKAWEDYHHTLLTLNEYNALRK